MPQHFCPALSAEMNCSLANTSSFLRLALYVRLTEIAQNIGEARPVYVAVHDFGSDDNVRQQARQVARGIGKILFLFRG